MVRTILGWALFSQLNLIHIKSVAKQRMNLLLISFYKHLFMKHGENLSNFRERS